MHALLIVPANPAAAWPEQGKEAELRGGTHSALLKALAARPGAIVLDLGDLAGDDRAVARRAAAGLLVAAAKQNGVDSPTPFCPPCQGTEAETCGTTYASPLRIIGRPRLFVRIAALPTGLVDDDLDVILEARPDAVVAPGIVGAHDVGHLGAKLAVREAIYGITPGATGIVAVAGDSARGILALGTLKAGPRLLALAYDGPALGHPPGSAPERTARGALVLAAMAAGVPAMDLGKHRSETLARACARARRDGFSACLARTPAEVATIEAAFEASRPSRPRP